MDDVPKIVLIPGREQAEPRQRAVKELAESCFGKE